LEENVEPVTTTPTEIPTSPAASFTEIVSSPMILESLSRMGLNVPTAVQRETIPAALAGSDIIAQAKTGSGKTLAFAIPLVSVVERSSDRTQTLAIVLTPTRELANQICEVVSSLSSDIQPVCVIGGMSSSSQVRALANDRRVVVGTPGRIMDLMGQGEISLRSCKFFAVDEVDEMFSMDFAEAVREILRELPKARQGMFVSATVTPRVETFAKNFLTKPRLIMVNSPEESQPKIEHRFYKVGSGVTDKVTALCDLIEVLTPNSAIIFCNTKSDTELVEVYLRRRGYDARLINSDLNQPQRDAIMNLIRSNKLRFLVGTDIAARGIDIAQIDLVVNYSLSDQHEIYVHRTGRTGRAGREGRAISLIGPHDFGNFMNLKRHLPIQIQEYELPSEGEVLQARITHLLTVLGEIGAAEPQLRDKQLAIALLQQVGILPEPNATITDIVAKLCRAVFDQYATRKAAERAAGESGSGATAATSNPDPARRPPRRSDEQYRTEADGPRRSPGGHDGGQGGGGRSSSRDSGRGGGGGGGRRR